MQRREFLATACGLVGLTVAGAARPRPRPQYGTPESPDIEAWGQLQWGVGEWGATDANRYIGFDASATTKTGEN